MALYHIHPEILREGTVWKNKGRRKEIINALCRYKGVESVAGVICMNHVYVRVAVPLKCNISNFMVYLKRKITLMIYDRYPELQSKRDKAF